MAVRKISDIETITKMNPNPDEKEVRPKTALQKEIKPDPVEKMMKKKNNKEFKPKTGGVFPAKKRSVKKMMFDYIVETCSVFHHGGSSSAKPNKTHKGN
ncbi:hypothetical protein PanWU01x14_216790 [Parasponia andersonii]|uniref:Uncharacterized protein n=1 Tax=Parasponia andersonii TaxID=3476 RepID=A0A2P5BRP9_PARAD|nr:hypothetical protein PanWU01x14_216790 [Parasponia andersonii]